MSRKWLILPIVSFIILAAHNLRIGSVNLALLWLCFVSLLFVKNSWVKYILTLSLLIGSVLWIKISLTLIQFRLIFNLPWIRLSLILGGVLIILLISIFIILAKGDLLFPRKKSSSHFQLASFLLSFILLSLAEYKTSFPILLGNRFSLPLGFIEIFILSTYSAWLTGKFLEPHKNKQLRPKIWLLFSCVFFAQLIFGLLGIQQMLMTGKLHLPIPALIVAGPIYRGNGFFMLILFISTIFLVGPAWCSYLCYIGAWDDFVSRQASTIKPLSKKTKWFQFINLILVIVVAYLLHLFNISWQIATFLAIIFGIIGLIIMIYFSKQRGQMVHCTTFCPIGFLSNILGKISPWRLKINPNLCSQCKKCISVCRYNALDLSKLTKGTPNISCTLCGDCIDECKSKAINLYLLNLNPSLSQKIFFTVISSIHAIFLGVARI